VGDGEGGGGVPAPVTVMICGVLPMFERLSVTVSIAV
jgi:hypothetical protein